MSDIYLPVGLRYAVVFALNSDGRPAATGLSAYQGIEIAGPKAYSLNVPDPRRIAHAGKDRVLVSDSLPTLESSSAEIQASSQDLDLEALLQNVKNFAVGDAKMLAIQTEQQGSEPTVGLLLYQQSKDKATGLRNWHFHIIPAAQVIPVHAGMGENPIDQRYTISPTPTTKHLWGVTLTLVTEGATEAGIFKGKSPYKPKLDSYLADGVEDNYVLAKTAANNTYPVYVDGVERTSNITKTTTDFTFTSSVPSSGADISAFYGQAS
jgi:hypothetical protein